MSISIYSDSYYAIIGLADDVIIDGKTYHHYKYQSSIYWQNKNVINKENYIPSMEGTWSGQMYTYSYYKVQYYVADNTEVTFLSDPYKVKSGTGYWVDYYTNAPYEYIANHFDWTLDGGILDIYFREDQTSINIYSFRINEEKCLIGYIYNNMYNYTMNRDFVLEKVDKPNSYWNNLKWGIDAWKNY